MRIAVVGGAEQGMQPEDQADGHRFPSLDPEPLHVEIVQSAGDAVELERNVEPLGLLRKLPGGRLEQFLVLVHAGEPQVRPAACRALGGGISTGSGRRRRDRGYGSPSRPPSPPRPPSW